MTTYTEQGYTNRKQYLDSLAENFGLDEEIVHTAAGMLGPNEDFDGLITTLEDYAEQIH